MITSGWFGAARYQEKNCFLNKCDVSNAKCLFVCATYFEATFEYGIIVCVAIYLSSITFLLVSFQCLIKLGDSSSEINTGTSTIFVSYHHLLFLLTSTILEEEKLQQKERNRMEMRRQVTVSWDSGGSDEAPPKVRHYYTTHVWVWLSACIWL